MPAAFGAPAVARDREGAVQLAWLDSPEPVSERARRGAARIGACGRVCVGSSVPVDIQRERLNITGVYYTLYKYLISLDLSDLIENQIRVANWPFISCHLHCTETQVIAGNRSLRP